MRQRLSKFGIDLEVGAVDKEVSSNAILIGYGLMETEKFLSSRDMNQ